MILPYDHTFHLLIFIIFSVMFIDLQYSKESNKTQPWQLLNIRKIWNKGICGENVRVGVFDTGISQNIHFQNSKLVLKTDWTIDNEEDSVFYQAIDGQGHGSFVSALIAGSITEQIKKGDFKLTNGCPVPGIAPSVELYVYRVFTDNQVSYTTWFLDAFNHAISSKLNVINLSIGGPDFMDFPFIEKVQELSANGILLISGIGNDGPTFGGLNNPGDQIDVLSVGGIDNEGQIAPFSSRGMTAWETPNGGYGRVKPDIVTYSTDVISADFTQYDCKKLSGTSVASPIVTAAVSLVVDAVIKQQSLPHSTYNVSLSPASIRQALIASALRLGQESGVGKPVTMYEQGSGMLNVEGAIDIAVRLKRQPSVFPSYVDLTDCPYMWPHCLQPLYATSLPVMLNLTIINSMGVSGKIKDIPVYHPIINKNGHWIKVRTNYPKLIWPWSGYIGLAILVDDNLPGSINFSGTSEGFLTFSISSTTTEGKEMSKSIKIPIRVPVIPPPPKYRRILWDQFRNLKYPPAYIPKDDLINPTNALDWLGDHVHTNYKDLYETLRELGYYVETNMQTLDCVDLSKYGSVLIIDPEEDFFPEEKLSLEKAVKHSGTSLIILADWYNETLADTLRFSDTNTQRWWVPDMYGSNTIAINSILSPFGFKFGGNAYAGKVTVGSKSFYFNSGSALMQLPPSSGAETWFLQSNEVELLTADSSNNVEKIKLPENKFAPLFSLSKLTDPKSGKIALYGDSNCVDSEHLKEHGCMWLFKSMLLFATSKSGRIHKRLFDSPNFINTSAVDYQEKWYPNKVPSTSLYQKFSNISKVIASFTVGQTFFHHHLCGKLTETLISPLTSEVDQIYVPQKLDLYPPEDISLMADFGKNCLQTVTYPYAHTPVRKILFLLKQWWEYALACLFFFISISLLMFNWFRNRNNYSYRRLYFPNSSIE